MDQNEVAIAFDIVLEEIENAIAAVNREGGQAFQAGKYGCGEGIDGKRLADDCISHEGC